MEAPSDSSGPVKIGDLFQGYRIVALLGQGGYASVYHARREFTGRDVAIKISNRAVTDEVFKRFQAEARLILDLEHPNIVKALDATVATSGHIYIVMELLLGQTYWHARKQHGKFTIPEALHLCVEAADGVEQAHRVGVIHRDLKPLNLFIIARNRGKVLDFGIAKIPNDGERSSTQRNLVHGTLKYMSPEQLLAEILTARSDIYALAVIFFELVTGRHPHIPENAELTEAQLSLAIVSRDADSLAAIEPSIPSYIVEVIAKALSRNPANRFASMAEFAEALRKCRERYVGEFPELAELRELWIPAPSASAVVRSEPPSQRHIATAVVAVVPAQSLRPTVRVNTAPPQPEPRPQPDTPVSMDAAAPPVQIAATPAPVSGGLAVTPRVAPTQKSDSGRLRLSTLRRIVPVGAAIGCVLGIGATLWRLPPAAAPKPASSADGISSVRTVPQVPVMLTSPTAPQPADVNEAVPPIAASSPVADSLRAGTPPSPPSRRQTITTQPTRSRSATKDAEGRLNWFQEDKRSTRSPAAKTPL